MRRARDGMGLAAVVTAVLGASAAMAGLVSAQAPSPAPPVFTSDVDVVAVDVNVVDKQGRPVRGLGPEDFTITVDKTPRHAVSAEFISLATEQDAEPSPPPSPDRIVSTNEGVRRGRIVLIVVDQGNIRPGVGRQALNAADRLLDALNPQDQVALITMPGGGPQVDLTTEHARVRDALKRVTGRAQYGGRRLSLAEAFSFEQDRSYEMEPILDRECPPNQDPRLHDQCVSDVQGEAFSVMANFRHQSQVSMSGLAALMKGLQQIEGPKTVVLVTEGLSSDQPDELRSVANSAAAARVAFFAIHIDESGKPDPSRDQAPATALEDSDLISRDLYRLSGLTRGAVFATTGSVVPFERIAREISGYYLVGFAPTDTDRDGKDHVVDVKVQRPGLTVRARRALPMAAPHLDQRETLTAALRSPLPAIELPLRVTTFAARDAATGQVRVVISAEVGRGGAPPAGLAVGFALVDEKGKVAASGYQRVADDAAPTTDRPVTYVGGASVAAGRYTLKLAAVDARGRRGSVEHPVRALLTAIGPLEVSDLVVAPPATGPGMTLRPGVDAAIDTGAVVAFLDLHATEADALGRATVAVELATEETGPTLVSAPARLSEAAHGQRSAQALLSLSLVPPGRYVARAVVSLAGKPLGQVTRPLMVAPSRSAGVAAGPSLSMPAPPYDRTLLLAPAALAEALDALAAAAPPSSPAVARALTEARQGHLDRLGDLLRGGETASAGLAFLRGLGLYASGDMTAAADQFRGALRLVPDLVPATVYLGAASAAIGRDQDAIGAWNTALLEDAHSPALSLLFADALLRTGEVDAAIDALREAAAAWPADDRFRNRLGLAYAASGRRAEAMPLLSAYVEAHPADVDASFAVVRLLYEAHPAGEEREQFLRYARAYVAAAGPRQALVAQWIKAVDAPPR